MFMFFFNLKYPKKNQRLQLVIHLTYIFYLLLLNVGFSTAS